MWYRRRSPSLRRIEVVAHLNPAVINPEVKLGDGRGDRSQLRDGPTASRDPKDLAVFDTIDQFGEPRLCLENANIHDLHSH